MATIRRIFRAFLLVGWLTFIGIVAAACFIGGRWESRRRVAKTSLLWGKGLAWIFGIKTKIIGDPKQITGGLIVSNHTGYVDILVHAGVWPIRFAAKDSIKYWPFIGWFVALGRPVWIDRTSISKSKIAEKEFRDSMANDILLLVYPEGTSTSGKDGILEFKSTPFEAAVRGDNWIMPAIIRYGDTPDGKPLAWYDDMTLLPHLWRIFGYKRIYAEITVMKTFKPEGRNRKELAEFTHKKMQEEYEKIFAGGDIII
jgi:1-acyl-sn-glycerol-3-phosphate acyltransferase